MKTSIRNEHDSLFLESPFELNLTSVGGVYIVQKPINKMPTVIESFSVTNVKNENGENYTIIKKPEIL